MINNRILILFLFSAWNCFANEEACNTDNHVKQMQCLDQEILKQQRIRETWVTKLEKQVEIIQNNTGNTQLFLSFQRSKNSFDTYVSDACQWRYLKQLPDTKNAALVYKRCELLVTKQQIALLKLGF